MPKEYTTEQFWKLYEKLPEELQKAIFSMETANNIWDICERNNIEKVSSIAKYVGNVLVGVLAPEDFQETLEKELKIEKEQAKETSREINRFIFYPIKEALWRLYHPSPLDKPEPGPSSTDKKPLTKEPEPDKPDTYREQVD
ncbi:MAG: hypothetical protein KYQ20_01975 [Candidatus Nealsonbacteria bacterium]|nr:hypothetical protein [Candidatus Nealsonbacteria bacterium]